ncbi:MAG: rhamnulose-1-phosphate aldolase [Bacteroidales bacterium]|nr:rhamnulose-1-phosphate aldolase [Bacteroidales bacterium]
MKEWLKSNKKVTRVIKDVAELANYLWQRGWAERNAGNISYNLSGMIGEEFSQMEDYPIFNLDRSYDALKNGYFFVTGTGKRMRDLARSPMKNACILKLTGEGNKYHIISRNKKNLYDFRPTSELPTHLSIHEQLVLNKSENRAVVHTHPNELVALTQIKEFTDEARINHVLWGMHPESVVFVPRGLALVPYTLPGTENIARETLKRLSDSDVIMWEKHGTFAVGVDVLDAFDKIDILSKSAQIFFMVRQAGYTPEGLSDEQIIELKKKFHSEY